MCLIMADTEPLKPSNTGWLIADVVKDTSAFVWSRTAVDPDLLTLLANPQWAPYLVFPGEFAAAERVVTEVQVPTGKRPLFVLLDGTWSEAGKMFRKSPYLNHLPVLSLQPEQLSRYALRRSTHDDHCAPRRWPPCAWHSSVNRMQPRRWKPIWRSLATIT